MAENYYLNHTATQIDAILTKVDGIAAGANVNVQADWDQTTTTADDYIKNKPTIPAAQIQSDWNQKDTESKDFIKNKPTIPDAQVNSDWNAVSGVAQILHKPTLGTAAAKDYTTTVTTSSTDLVTSGAVNSAIPEKAVGLIHYGTLISNISLNEVTVIGTYKADNVDYITSKPDSAVSFRLYVGFRGDTDGLVQIYNPADSNKEYRRYGNSTGTTWSDWELVNDNLGRYGTRWQGTRAEYEALQTDDYDSYEVIETPSNNLNASNSNSLSSFASPLTQPQANDYMNTPGLVDESDQVGETE